jgi:hypothetical protein
MTKPTPPSTAKILLALEAAGSAGATGKEIAEVSSLPEGTVSSRLTALRYAKAINVLEPGHRPMRYCLSRFGGTWLSPNTSKQEEHQLSSKVRIVVDFDGERKSLSIEGARVIYLQLKEVFA